MAENALKIYEIYTSLQGEGSRMGLACTLVRLVGCDLRCRWCDTAYAFHGGRWMTIDEILAEVDRLGCRLVEITGGEPLLQERVHVLIAALLERDYEVLLETGGHRDLAPVDRRVVRIMDLKAPGSGESDRNLWSNLECLVPQDEVKIVIADRADYEWARAIVRDHDLASRAHVLFSPVHGAVDPADLAAWILADRLPVRMQLQLHKLLWGAEARGV
jgi:7-carboxy-7-deazaguanine synthase